MNCADRFDSHGASDPVGVCTGNALRARAARLEHAACPVAWRCRASTSLASVSMLRQRCCSICQPWQFPSNTYCRSKQPICNPGGKILIPTKGKFSAPLDSWAKTSSSAARQEPADRRNDNAGTPQSRHVQVCREVTGEDQWGRMIARILSITW